MRRKEAEQQQQLVERAGAAVKKWAPWGVAVTVAMLWWGERATQERREGTEPTVEEVWRWHAERVVTNVGTARVSREPSTARPFAFLSLRNTEDEAVRRALDGYAVSSGIRSFIPCFQGVECETYAAPMRHGDGYGVMAGHLRYASVTRQAWIQRQGGPSASLAAEADGFDCATLVREPVARIRSCWAERMPRSVVPDLEDMALERAAEALGSAVSAFGETCAEEPVRVFADVGASEHALREQHNDARVLNQTLSRLGSCVVGVAERCDDTAEVFAYYFPWFHFTCPHVDDRVPKPAQDAGLRAQSPIEVVVYEFAMASLDAHLDRIRRPLQQKKALPAGKKGSSSQKEDSNEVLAALAPLLRAKADPSAAAKKAESLASRGGSRSGAASKKKGESNEGRTVGKRPNLALVLLDDLSPDMVSVFEELENPEYQAPRYDAPPTPNLRAMARHGVAFKTAWAPAMCTPSRVTLMTGKYPCRTGVYHNLLAMATPDEAKAHVQFSTLLRRAGYATAVVGKWGIGGGPFPGVLADAGFDERIVFEAQDFDPASKQNCRPDATLTSPLGHVQTFMSRYWHPCYTWNRVFLDGSTEFGPDLEWRAVDHLLDAWLLLHQGAGGSKKKTTQKKSTLSKGQSSLGGETHDDHLSSDTLEHGASFRDAAAASRARMLSKDRDDDAPFFLYWPTVLVHETESRRLPSIRFRDLDPSAPVELTPGSAWLERMRDLVAYADWNCGKLLEKVVSSNMAENTVLWVLSDNGGAYTGKTTGLERGASVLSVAWGGPIKKRGPVGALSDMTDVAPTLLRLAGVDPAPLQGDGVSHASYMTGDADDEARDFVAAEMSGSRLVRTKNGLLEAHDPLLDYPGRLYQTPDDRRFWTGYDRCDPSLNNGLLSPAATPACAAAAADVRRALDALPPALNVSAVPESFATFHRSERQYHLYSHAWYGRGKDESKPVSSWPNNIVRRQKKSPRIKKNRDASPGATLKSPPVRTGFFPGKVLDVSEWASNTTAKDAPTAQRGRKKQYRLPRQYRGGTAAKLSTAGASRAAYSSVLCRGRGVKTRTCRYRRVCASRTGVVFFIDDEHKDSDYSPLRAESHGIHLRNVNGQYFKGEYGDTAQEVTQAWIPRTVVGRVPERRSVEWRRTAVFYDYTFPAIWGHVLIDDMLAVYATVTGLAPDTDINDLDVVLARGCALAPAVTESEKQHGSDNCRLSYTHLLKALTSNPVAVLPEMRRPRCYDDLFVGFAGMAPPLGMGWGLDLDGRPHQRATAAFFAHLRRRLAGDTQPKKQTRQDSTRRLACLVTAGRRRVDNMLDVCEAVAARFDLVVDAPRLPAFVRQAPTKASSSKTNVSATGFVDDRGLPFDMLGLLRSFMDASFVVTPPGSVSFNAFFCRTCLVLTLGEEREAPLFAAMPWITHAALVPKIKYGDFFAEPEVSTVNVSHVLEFLDTHFGDAARGVFTSL